MRVLLKAYISGNLGDDLMIRTLCRRYPNVEFAVSGAGEYRAAFADMGNIIYIPSDTLLHKLERNAVCFARNNRRLDYSDILAMKSAENMI